ncbi:MAG: fused MFS/spermidine synthase [Acidobacteriota bacterium]
MLQRDRATDWRFGLMACCFVLSGIAGLVYETAWSQELALVFGTSDLAISAVLAAYMGGMAFGARLVDHRLPVLRRPLIAYAVLEVGIALAALAVPLWIEAARRLRVALFAGPDLAAVAEAPAAAGYYLVAAFVVLLLPTALMGATLPVLVRAAVHRDDDIGRRVGLLYGANTAGAALGALLAAFVLLPSMGLERTVWVAVILNLLVAGLAVALDRSAATSPSQAGPAEHERKVPSAAGPVVLENRWVLPVMAISGAVAFGWEVLWTRLLAHLVGGSIYAFGLMLATFLCGLALGASAASRLARRRDTAAVRFALCQAGVAIASWLAFVGLDALAGRAAAQFGEWRMLGWCASALLPGALFLGASFPFAVRLLTTRPDDTATASARVYVWNTLGTIVGALATGFVLLPSLHFAGTATLWIAVGMVTAGGAALGATRAQTRRRLVIALTLVGLTLALAPPSTPWNVLRTAPLTGRQAQGEALFHGVGRSATVLLLAEQGGWRLSTNGLPESVVQPPGAAHHHLSVARWLSIVPVARRPASQSMVIVGLGGGLTAAAVPTTIDTVDVVELESEVVAANRQVAALRDVDPLADPRLRLVVADARGALQLAETQVDIIVSQPSHPWTAGASHLFTREYFELAKTRLRDDGVFVQWIGLRFVDEALLRSLLATLLSVFPHLEVYAPPPGNSLLFLGSRAPLDPPTELGTVEPSWHRVGITTTADLHAARRLDTETARQVAGDAPLITDRRNLLKIHSPRLGDKHLDVLRFEELVGPLDPLVDLPLSTLADPALWRALRRTPGGRLRATRLLDRLEPSADRAVATAVLDLGTDADDARQRLRSLARQPDAAGQRAFHWLIFAGADRRQLESDAKLARRLRDDPDAATIVEARHRVALGETAGVQALEATLAAIDPASPLALEALRLRAGWRVATGGPEAARDAFFLLEPRLADPATAPATTLARLRAAIRARDAGLVAVSLREVRRQPMAANRQRIRRTAAAWLSRLDPAFRADVERAFGEPLTPDNAIGERSERR